MAASKKDLAQKIAVMQVANAGGTIYTKAEGAENWAKTKNPAFNWGLADYKVGSDNALILSNTPNTTIDFIGLATNLKYLERGKNLEDEVSYASQQINDLEESIKSNISTNIDIDCSSLNKSSLLQTSFFKTLIDNSDGDNDIINAYVTEIQNIVKRSLRDSIVTAANEIVTNSVNELLDNLPKEQYDNNAPTIEHLKEIVSRLSAQIADAYPDITDGTIMELEEEGITVRFWKNIAKENVLSVSYDLAKATVGGDPSYNVVTDSLGNVTYSEIGVTHTELNNAIADAIAASKYNDDVNRDNIINYTESTLNALHDLVLEEIDDKIEAKRPSILHDALEQAEDLNAVFYRELKATMKGMFLENVYPVGSFYMTEKSPDDGGDPNELFGGTWERVKDRFILAAGDAYAAGSMGGESVHTLQESEMPKHLHSFSSELSVTTDLAGEHQHGEGISLEAYVAPEPNDDQPNTDNTDNTDNNENNEEERYTLVQRDLSAAYGTTQLVTENVEGHSHTIETTVSGNTSEVGGGLAHNNMPPYLCAFIWKRIE